MELQNRLMYGIKDKNGNLVTNHEDINNVFREFYEGLYRSEGQMDINKARDAFEHLNL